MGEERCSVAGLKLCVAPSSGLGEKESLFAVTCFGPSRSIPACASYRQTAILNTPVSLSFFTTVQLASVIVRWQSRKPSDLCSSPSSTLH